jgi:hypothetical protein
MAVQNALPKASSAHAIQLEGSPEQVAEDVGCSAKGGAEPKIRFTFDDNGPPRRGIGG